MDLLQEVTSNLKYFATTAEGEAMIQRIQVMMLNPRYLQEKDHSGLTLLHHATWLGHIPTIHALLDRGANIDAQDDDGCTALCNATFSENTAVVELLLNRSAQPNIPNNTGAVALLSAIQSKNFKTMHLLLSHGADCNLMNAQGKSMLGAAIETEDTNLVQLLLDYGADPNVEYYKEGLLRLAVHHAEMFQMLLEHGADSKELPIDDFLLYDDSNVENNYRTCVDYVLYGGNTLFSEDDALTLIPNLTKRIEIMRARAHIYEALLSVLNQLTIKIDQKFFPEILRFLSRVPYWRYLDTPLKTLKAYYAHPNYSECFDPEKNSIASLHNHWIEVGLPVEMIDSMMGPLFERASHIYELSKCFDLPKAIITKLYDELKTKDSPLHEFLKVRLEHNWVKSTWKFPNTATPTIQPQP